MGKVAGLCWIAKITMCYD